MFKYTFALEDETKMKIQVLFRRTNYKLLNLLADKPNSRGQQKKALNEKHLIELTNVLQWNVYFKEKKEKT